MIIIKQRAATAGIESISTKDKHIILHFYVSPELDMSRIPEKYRDAITLGTKQVTLGITQKDDNWKEVLSILLENTVPHSS